jgi:hypothetical protein
VSRARRIRSTGRDLDRCPGGYQVSVLSYRPEHIDGPKWCEVRREWNAAAEMARGRTMVARKELALRLGMTFDTLQRWAKRCGWQRQRHNGRGR